LTVVLGIAWFSQGRADAAGQCKSVRIQPLFGANTAAPWLAAIPWLGRCAGRGLAESQRPGVSGTCAGASSVVAVVQTRFGLRLRAVGENPQMVDAAGVSVLRYALCRD
jgi:ABC-type uncharacterized transport system permease subunit